jgi:hypothetical protein
MNDWVASKCNHGIVVSEFVTPALDGKTMELQQLAGAAFEPPVWAMNPSDDEINELVHAVRC